MNQAENKIYNHIMGKTRYVDDIPCDNNTIYGYVLYSKYAYADIKSIDTSEAEKIEGIEAILTSKDIPGINDMGSINKDENILAEKQVLYIGQAIALIAATNKESAEIAKKVIKIEYKELRPLLDVEESFQKGDFPYKPLHLSTGNVETVFSKGGNIIEGKIEIGGQEQFYLETQAAYAKIKEDGSLYVYSSTQNPTEVQEHIAKAINKDSSNVEVETGRIGGGFGGKETQGAWCAIWASLLANKTGKNVKMVLSRDDDLIMTGKRHPATIYYKAAYTNQGKILAYKVRYLFNIGYACDLSNSINERCMLHSDNAYFIPSIEIDIYPCKTNTASNTAFRGFGAPQGIATIEYVIDSIAYKLNKDPLTVRKINLYGIKNNNITPYGEKVKDNSLHTIYSIIKKQSDYTSRLQSVKKFNSENKWIKRGIGVTPVKFGISFVTSFLNQATALVNIYRDGSVIVHQGGVEMGQGLYDKIMIIASRELGVPLSKVKVYNTNTSVIPNTSATAASTGSDINGQATVIAIRKLKKRLEKVAATLPKGASFQEIINKAYFSRVSLSAKGYYSPSGIYFDKDTSRGCPFFYYVYGWSISEIEIDLLTASHRIIRTDIVHDTGCSIDEAIDKGQIEGAFIQGSGWCTIENLKWNEKGFPITATSELYKIPGIYDIPKEFDISLYQQNPFKLGILSSRAIGEPPLIYGLSVWSAIRNALVAAKENSDFNLNLPATKDRILDILRKSE